jgi:lysophospholipase L1-like esterase
MKILFIGDSITKGKLGASFVELIAKKHTSFQITNLGKDGETVNVVSNRLLNHLKTGKEYDYIVFQGGYNDILLPSFLEKGKLFKWAYKQQIKKGHIPLSNPGEFTCFLKKSIRSIKQLYKGKIILLTIGCVGENLNTELNLQRNKFNEAIRNIALEEEIILADTQIEFDKFLMGKTQSNYCLDNFWAVTLWDRFKKEFKKISKKRELFLTIDGVHLNNAGAAIFANCILNKLETKQKNNKNWDIINSSG